MRLRTWSTTVAAAGAVLAGASTAVAVGPGTTEVDVVAKVAGGAPPTAKRPRPVTLGVHLAWSAEGDDTRSTLQRLVMRFPPGAIYNGAHVPACPQTTIDRRGPRACPKGSIVGHGTAKADADRAPTSPTITVVNGGRDRVWFYTHLQNPAVVDVAIPGTIRRLSGRWSLELTVDIPPVIQIVAGTPIYLKSMDVTAGKGDWIAVSRPPTAVGVTTTLARPHS